MTIASIEPMEKTTSDRNGRGRNGDGFLDFDEVFESSQGRVDTIDRKTEPKKIIVLKPNGAIIEFLGMPKGGKTAQIETLISNLREDSEFSGLEIELFKPNTYGKRAHAKEIDRRGLFHENIVWHQGAALAGLNLRPKNEKVYYREIDLAIFDRGVIDSLVWTEYLFRRRALSSEQRSYLNGMIGKAAERIHLAIGMNIVPEEAMRREGDKEGTVMNPKSLEQLYAQYMLLDYLNDADRAELMKGDTSYHDILQDYFSQSREDPNYYEAFVLRITNYLGIECKVCDTEEEKREDREMNAQRIYDKVSKVVRARRQESTTEA